MVRTGLFGNMNIAWVKELEGEVAYYSSNILGGLIYLGVYIYIYRREIVWENNNSISLELF